MVQGEVHYLAHHPVVRQDKQTTKVRVVYDASAKKNGGPSLNDCLYSGPPLSETIADVLVRFRCHKTALVGDLEKAFLMISVAEDDRDALRFLWFDDPFSEEPNIIVFRFARVAFGLSSSPFLLNATLKHHIMMYDNEDPEFVQKLLQSLYVDDIISGDSDDIGAYKLYIKAKSRLAEGGFNASKFVSNSKKLSGCPAKSGPLDFGTKNNFPSFFVSEKGLVHIYKNATYYFPVSYFCLATSQNSILGELRSPSVPRKVKFTDFMRSATSPKMQLAEFRFHATSKIHSLL